MSRATPKKKARPAFDVGQVLAEAREVIQAEAQAVSALSARLDAGFIAAVERLLACRGRVVVSGMGKSGIVAQKISATLASTGTPSLFLHAAEALHGDLGRITADDVVLCLSNSGESEEIVRLLRPVKDLGAILIAITGARSSTLARHADVIVDLGDIDEACPMGLVPTASTTAMMVIGDALAMCVFNRRGFGREEYARFHPGGALGRKLMRVREVMRTGDENPVVDVRTSLADAIAVMTKTRGRPGATSIVDGGTLIGFFTDGDLRRLIEHRALALDRSIADVMQRHPKAVQPEQLVAEASRIMREHQIDQLPVVDARGAPVGFLDIQDLLATRAF